MKKQCTFCRRWFSMYENICPHCGKTYYPPIPFVLDLKNDNDSEQQCDAMRTDYDKPP